MNDPQTTITLYGHARCPMVPPVRTMLNGAGAAYHYVDIHQDEAGRQQVRAINAGNESVPTLVFPDGSTLTEPNVRQVQHKLAELGYAIPLSAQIMARLPQMVILAVIAWGVLRLLGVV